MGKRKPDGVLTMRQKQAVQHLANGLNHLDAARQIGVGVRTLRTHLEHARQILGARNTGHALVEAKRRNLID